MYSSAPLDQAMAQPLYSPEEIGFDPSSKREALSLAPSGRRESHYESVDRSSGCMSPSTELDSKNRHSTRRRIQVACNRCRKRKIKCSGDPGDGQGCSNCRTSGNTNCQFLRVNSSMLQTKASSWNPYPSGTATMPSSQRPGLYVPSMTPKIGGAPMTAPPTFRMTSFPRASNYDMGSAHAQSAYHRFPFGVDPPVHYEEDASAYTTPSSAYMSGVSPNVFTDLCTWNPKTWGHSVHVDRSPHGPVFSDSDAETALTHSAFFNLTQSTDAPPIVPTMSFSAVEGQGENRTLPNPSRNQAQMGLCAFTTPEEALSGLPHDYRMSSWTPKNTFLNHGSMQSPHGGYRSGPIKRPKTTSDMLYGLLPSSGTSSPLISAGSFTTTMDTINAEDGQPSRTFSHDHLSDYGSDTYVYSSSERRDKGQSKPDGSGSMLLNGLSYTRPPLGHHSSPPLIPTSAFRSTTEMHHTAIPASQY
ncbi:hypothetical protein BO94DRAFT_472473 [Aspergillus sclerotioniger CBS 115572]|uniref:Zn(2)-C6 fungal-type domain-containing protein n=1 Tax=Aspergillus sclerotioniger CBS 115572 TaxID=1450535 RepID=A0A317VV12_9EURO|nr:hypothetical protein BO94DRAFT_472473 [Aspergillus sclerotioniger CBS 115572]PWY78143.1 hypothetical protein BO94DRAFT_472473 [Aspergillus sclerotioniger CBS 115572]